jgi:hypothetical protein
MSAPDIAERRGDAIELDALDIIARTGRCPSSPLGTALDLITADEQP